jgi:hypothetical protein
MYDWTICLWNLAIAAEVKDKPEADYYFCVEECAWEINEEVWEENYEGSDWEV